VVGGLGVHVEFLSQSSTGHMKRTQRPSMTHRRRDNHQQLDMHQALAKARLQRRVLIPALKNKPGDTALNVE